ncbi:hypothetical protein BIU98_12650 [Curtobacterium sp. MMLR14_010]|uniref:YciI family protein n=1 Tax=Curtobacterium sp. MMLR14_010 TaxID=1898743 RepID=UPI0008DDB4E3|nr:YciI family protein [Curtobacterium sp. MMLR14_010]OII38986.1 hypothetical protein BIU98_12650 [Curtobacterium sp. MMLR14_010]
MQFLVNVIDDGQAEAAGRTESATAAEADAVQALNDRLQADGRIVFAGGLAGPADSVVVDARSGDAVVTEGPVVDAAEYVAGFWVLELPDVETARAVAAEASTACNRRIELRPLL